MALIGFVSSVIGGKHGTWHVYFALSVLNSAGGHEVCG